MKLQLSGPPSNLLHANIEITGSKSESNRLLLLQALFPNISIQNVSNSDDARAMREGLLQNNGEVNIHHAGTAMRFLTAYFATQQGKEVILTGSQRMQERPIKVLVEALLQLGADISYLKNEGYPPIKIKGKTLQGKKVSLPANISSQYISALLLVAPSLATGLEIELIGQITSVPYIKMTLGLLAQIGVSCTFEDNQIKVQPQNTVNDKIFVVESDWSSASYFYSIVALSNAGTEISLSSYKESSLQGDSVLADIYQQFGVTTAFKENCIVLKKLTISDLSTVYCELSDAPDLAQTIAVTCFGLGIGCQLTGLHTLKIKETDRLEAIKTELAKMGATITVTHNSMELQPSETIKHGIAVNTYNDHRMAMAFAPLALKTSLFINDAEVVSKSYPDFWKDLEELQFTLKKY